MSVGGRAELGNGPICAYIGEEEKEKEAEELAEGMETKEAEKKEPFWLKMEREKNQAKARGRKEARKSGSRAKSAPGMVKKMETRSAARKQEARKNSP